MTTPGSSDGDEVGPQALDDAREAARGAGVPVGLWVDDVILGCAADRGVEPPDRTRASRSQSVPAHALDGRPAGLQARAGIAMALRHREEHQVEDDGDRRTGRRLAELSDRLDRLTRGVERLAEANVASLQRLGSEEPSRRLADLVAKLDRRLDQLCGEGRSAGMSPEQRLNAGDFVAAGRPAERTTDDADRQGPPGIGPGEPPMALNEIADRQRALDGYAPLASSTLAPAGTLAPAPSGRADTLPRATTQELSELEQQLRRINAQMETSKEPSGHEQAVDSLRDQLAEIARMLQEAMPRKAIEALEQEVRSLADRVDRSRGSGGDAAALGGIERGLEEVRDGLRALAPAETLAAVERAVQELSQKIGRTAATPLDPSKLGQLENAVGALRDRVAQAASGKRTRGTLGVVQDTLGHVVDRLGKIETGMHGTSAGQPVSSTPAVPASPGAALPSLVAPALAFVNAVQPADWQSAARPGTGTVPGAPIDPELPPDHPLDPGSGAAPARIRGSAAERIAASQAAFGLAKQPLMTEPVGKPNFIAAARRAAQAAVSEAPVGKEHPAVTSPGKLPRPLGMLPTLIAGVSAVLLLLGILQFTRGFLGDTSDGHVNAVSESSQAAPMGPESPRPGGATEGQAGRPTLPPAAPPETPAAAYSSSASGVLPAVALANSPEPTGASVEGRPAIAASPTPEATAQPAELTGSVSRPAKGTAGSAKAAAFSASGSATSATAQPARASAVGRLPPELGSALRAAAASGDPSAQFEVALRYAEGRGVAQSLTEAARWFERAANQGSVPAQFRLAGLYEKGLGVTRNLDTARRYYAAAGEAGNAKALHNLALLYAEGMGGNPDYRTAARWFRRAADHGLIDSQYNLAVLSARGIGVEQNLAEAYRWFALAAREGDPEASRKRDEVAARLDARALQSAIQAVRAWRAEPQPPAANHVEVPPGGWDAKLPSEPASAPPRRKPAATPPKGELASPQAAQ